MKITSHILTKIGNIYYVIDEEEFLRKWFIKDKRILACSTAMEECPLIDKSQIETFLFSQFDPSTQFEDRTIELEAEINQETNKLQPKIIANKVNIISIK